MLDQILAVILFLIVGNSFKRLTMGIKARYTSWGLFLIVINVFLAFRLPNALNWKFFEEYGDWERLVVYLVALGLNIWDWIIYDKLVQEVKDHKKKYVRREDHEILVQQLAVLKREEDKTNDSQ